MPSKLEVDESPSLDVLCRRAERLIENVRSAYEQTQRLYSRPDRTAERAEQLSKTLEALNEQLSGHLQAAELAQARLGPTASAVTAMLGSVEGGSQALLDRVRKAAELAQRFGTLLESAEERLTKLEASADEARQGRDALASATDELRKARETAAEFERGTRAMTRRQIDLLRLSRTTTTDLTRATATAMAARAALYEDVRCLEDLLGRSAAERKAWDALLGPAEEQPPVEPVAVLPSVAMGIARPGTSRPGPLNPGALAAKLSRMGDLVRDAQAQAQPPTVPEQPASITEVAAASRLELAVEVAGEASV